MSLRRPIPVRSANVSFGSWRLNSLRSGISIYASGASASKRRMPNLSTHVFDWTVAMEIPFVGTRADISDWYFRGGKRFCFADSRDAQKIPQFIREFSWRSLSISEFLSLGGRIVDRGSTTSWNVDWTDQKLKFQEGFMLPTCVKSAI